MTALYVDSAGGDDANAGTISAPWKTLAKLQASIAATDTANLSGTFRETFAKSGVNNITLQQWIGMPQAIVRGDTLVPAGDWSLVAGDVYNATIVGVAQTAIWNWDTNLTSEGLHFGHLVPGTFGALNAGQWAQSGTTLQIRLAGAMADPTVGDTYAFCVATNALIEIISSADSTVQGLDVRLTTTLPNTPDGYAVLMTECTNPTINNCDGWDCGAHIFGCVNSGATALGASRILNCNPYALHGGGSVGQNQIVTFSSGAGGINNSSVASCRGRVYGAIAWNETPLDATQNNIGSLHHGGVIVSSIIYRDMIWRGVDGHVSQPFGYANTSTLVTDLDEDDLSKYAVQYIDCRAENCTQLNIRSNGNSYDFATVRCFFDFTRAGRDGMRFSSGSGIDISLGDLNAVGSNTSHMLNISSVFLFDNRELWSSGGTKVGEATGTRSKGPDDTLFANSLCILLHRRVRLVNHNSTFLALNNATSGSNGWYWFSDDTSTAIKNIDCILASHNNANGGGLNMMFATTGIPASAMDDSDGTLYFNIATYSKNVLWDTEPEFNTLIDTNGTFAVNPDLANLSNTMTVLADAEPVAGGYVRSNPLVRSGVSFIGINGGPYDGTLGAHQFGFADNAPSGHGRLMSIGVLP